MAKEPGYVKLKEVLTNSRQPGEFKLPDIRRSQQQSLQKTLDDKPLPKGPGSAIAQRKKFLMQDQIKK